MIRHRVFSFGLSAVRELLLLIPSSVEIIYQVLVFLRRSIRFFFKRRGVGGWRREARRFYLAVWSLRNWDALSLRMHFY
jgi:hypothetical protein